VRKKEREKSKSMKEKECEKSKSTKEKSQIFESRVPEPKDAQQGEKQWSSQSTFVMSGRTQLSTLAHPPPPCLGARVAWCVRHAWPNATKKATDLILKNSSLQ
jgi:hypothetical protein